MIRENKQYTPSVVYCIKTHKDNYFLSASLLRLILWHPSDYRREILLDEWIHKLFSYKKPNITTAIKSWCNIFSAGFTQCATRDGRIIHNFNYYVEYFRVHVCTNISFLSFLRVSFTVYTCNSMLS